MSTATKAQTRQERDQVIEQWDAIKGPLAETQKNLQIMAEALVGYQKKNGDFLSVEILNAVVQANAHQLDWLAQAPKPTVKKGDAFQKLAEVGVLKSSHMSVLEQQSESKKVEDRQAQFLTRAHLLNEQATLLEAQRDAEYGNVVMHRLGIDHYRTGEKRKAAKAKLAPKLADFNNRCVTSGNDNLAIA